MLGSQFKSKYKLVNGNFCVKCGSFLASIYILYFHLPAYLRFIKMSEKITTEYLFLYINTFLEVVG